MALIPFDPLPGLNTDDTSFAARGQWADGNNVRFWEKKPQTIPGYVTARTLAGGTSCVQIFAFNDNAGFGSLIVYGMSSDDKLYIAAGFAPPTEIGVASFPNSVNYWSFDTYGDTLMVAPENGTLYQWTTGAGTVTEITQAPDKIICMLVTPQRQVLALGCNEELSSTFNPRCIRGSDLEDPTDWTTGATNNAFEYILESSGAIVAARMIGAYVAVWTETSLHLGQFIGDPGQTYRFDRVDDGCGAVGANAVCVQDGAAYWLGPEGVLYTWTPGALPTPIANPIGKQFLDTWDRDNASKTLVYPVPRFSEIWVHYNAGGTNFPSKYMALSLKDGTWSKGSMTRTAVLTGDLVDQIMTAALPYDPGSYIAANFLTVYAQGHGQSADGAALSWFIQSADQYIDNGGRLVMIRGAIPDFEDQAGSVNLTLFCRDRAQSSAVTKGPYELAVGASKKDFRASGKLVSVKFSNAGATSSHMRLGKPLFDTVPLGER
jgi:hypothetical protein